MARSKFKIKRGDTVVVLAGKDKGQTGKVLRLLPARDRIVVEGVNIVKRHNKAQGDQPGRIVPKEAPVHISNVALYNEEEGRAVKVRIEVRDGKKVRVDKSTGAAIDA